MEIDLAFWNANGYCVLPQFFSRKETDSILEEEDRAWATRSDQIIVDNQIYDPYQPRIHSSIGGLTAKQRSERFVINDLFLYSPVARKLALDPRLLGVLRTLLGTEPILWQSLNFKWGTAQGLHQDTLYLPPPNERDMLAIWIALEDIHPQSGPLRYLGGSHRIPPFRFSTGKMRFIPEEVPQWEDHISRYRQEMKLSESHFLAKRGDVFIWHAYLVHGGADIGNFDLTRRSYVCHYYSLEDVVRGIPHVPVKVMNDGRWCARGGPNVDELLKRPSWLSALWR